MANVHFSSDDLQLLREMADAFRKRKGNQRNLNSETEVLSRGCEVYTGYTTSEITGATLGAKLAITSIGWSSGLVTVETEEDHNFRVGQVITLSGIVPDSYNGAFTVGLIPSLTSFVFPLLLNPGPMISLGTVAETLLGSGTVELSNYYKGLTPADAGFWKWADDGFAETVYNIGPAIQAKQLIQIVRDGPSGLLMPITLGSSQLDVITGWECIDGIAYITKKRITGSFVVSDP